MSSYVDQNQLPLVSVLMTAYNREKFIAESIQSVLGSTFERFELIVVDDGSNDATVEIANRFAARDKRIKIYINESNLGDYPNRNKAASYASGKYLKYLDSDDIMYPHCLQVMVAAMEIFPEGGFGLSAIADPDKPYPVCLDPHGIYKEHFRGYGHFNRSPGSAIFRRDIFEKENGFIPDRHIGDTEFFLRLGLKYSMVKFPADLYWSRIHTSSESFREIHSGYSKFRKKLIKNYLNSDLCPLNESEKKQINDSFLKETLKRILRR